MALLNFLLVIFMLVILLVGVWHVLSQWLKPVTMEDLVKSLPEEDQKRILCKEIDGEQFFVKDPVYWDAHMNSLVDALSNFGVTRGKITQGFTPYHTQQNHQRE